jgi:membrane associated rhomboid family serine protease
MIPLRDDIPSRMTPIVTRTLIGLNILAFLGQILLDPSGRVIVHLFGAIPANLMGRLADAPSWLLPAPVTVVSSMFLHGGFIHLGGNMLYLHIFGDNVEDAMGHTRFLIFYMVCGALAAYANAAVTPESTTPMIGASGAVSGILGAYLILYPRARIVTLVPIFYFIQIVQIPAIFILGFWIAAQLVNGLLSLGLTGGGIAWFAHVGGFFAGMALVKLFRKKWRLVDG